MRRIFLFAIPVLLGACSNVPLQFRGPYPLDGGLAAAAHARFAPGAPAVILSERRRVKYLWNGQSPNGFEQNIYRAILIRRTDALDHGTVMLPYSADDIEDLSAVTRLPDGRAVELDPRTMLSVPRYRSAGEDAETRYATVLPFPEVQPGAIIELSFTVKKSDWVPIAALELPVNLPIERAELVIIHPPDLSLSRRSFPNGWLAADARENAFYHSSTFVLSDHLPGTPLAFRSEKKRVSIDVLWASLNGMRHVRFFEDWALSAGYAWREWMELAKLEKPPRIEMPKIVDAAPRAEAIRRWVEEKILDRTSAYDPPAGLRTAQEIVDSRLGSDNDRALVIFALLERERLSPSLVVLDDGGSELHSTPRPIHFGRDALLVVVRDGEKDVWIDPACLSCAAGALHPGRQHRPGIILSAARPPRMLETVRQGGSLPESVPEVSALPIHTPAEEVPGRAGELYALKLTPRGLLVTEGRIEYRGTDAAELRAWAEAHASAKVKKEEEARKFVDGWADGEVSVETSRDRAVVKLSDVLLARSGFVHAGSHVVIDLAAIFSEPWISAASRPRKEPLRFSTKRGFDRTLELQLAPGTRVVSLPKRQDLTSKAGTYAASAAVEKGRVVIHETLALSELDVSVKDHPKLRAFLRDVEDARRQPLVLVEPSSAPPAEPPSERRSQR